METSQSEAVFKRLCSVIPGGVNSPFRAFSMVGGVSRVIDRGEGAYIWDIDGNRYLDFCCAWGPLIAGHAHPYILEQVHKTMSKGTVFGASTQLEAQLAEKVVSLSACCEKVRFVNSGAEAVRSAVRLARAATQRTGIVKLEGCYHGHVEPLDSIGPEAEEAGGHMKLGSPRGIIEDTVLCEFNNIKALRCLLEEQASTLAAVLVEPVTGSMGVIEPLEGYLEEVIRLCRDFGVLVIFDEVLSGFRIALGGAQERYHVAPDIVCYGKAIGGGFPIGAYGASSDLMDLVAPLGEVYQAGTFSGNPVSMAGGLAAIELMERNKEKYAEFDRYTVCLKELEQQYPDLIIQGVGGMFSIGLGDPGPLRSFRDMERLSESRFAKLYHRLLTRGYYLPPSTFDAAGYTFCHTESEVLDFQVAIAQALEEI